MNPTLQPKPEEVAEARVAEALSAVEEAQRQLERATQALSRINGMLFEWRKLGRLHDQVTRAWYDLYARRDQIRRKGGLALDELV